jgi:hypothetical protein
MAKRKLGCLPIVGIFLLVGLIGSAISGGNDQGDSTATQTTSATPKPTRTTQAATNQCTTIRTNVTMIRNAFTEGEATPQQMSALLNSAAGDWRSASNSSSGSMSEWLAKMSELSLELDSYILTGSPSNGGVLLDQLFANLNLVDQFC